MVDSDVLSDVVAYVCCSSDPCTQAALIAKLKHLGAKHAARLSKEVTHVVFQRRANPAREELLVEDAEVRLVYDKVAKVSDLHRKQKVSCNIDTIVLREVLAIWHGCMANAFRMC
jgi:hypothetical protein